MKHKGYLGAVWMDDEARVFRGKVVDIADTVTFQGSSFEEVDRAFRDSVDDYLEFCASRDERPDKPFSGRIPVRVAPEVHRILSAAAQTTNQSLNALLAGELTKVARKARARMAAKATRVAPSSVPSASAKRGAKAEPDAKGAAAKGARGLSGVESEE